MANLPQKTGAASLLDANTSVAQQQTNFGNWLQFLIDLFGTGDSSTGRAVVMDVGLGAGLATPNLSFSGGAWDLSAFPVNRTFTASPALPNSDSAITGFGTVAVGAERELRFQSFGTGINTLSVSGTLLVPGYSSGQAFRIYQGDCITLVSLGLGSWRVRDVRRTWGPDIDLVTWRNRLINGDMRIDQRNAGASVTPTATQYIVDRWRLAITQASKITAGQNLGAVTPPTGFKNYLGFQTASAFASASTDAFTAEQPIEGVNVADLGWGTAAAQMVQVSFWYRSSLIGTHSASVRNSAANRSYPFSFTVNSANTWEQKSVLVPGDTAGTWATDTSAGLILAVDLGTGTNFRGTAGAWAASNLVGVTGAVSMVGTLSATIQFTGAQLEVGGTATPFERREYSSEFSRSQRYYQSGGSRWDGQAQAGVGFSSFAQFKVSMRAAPTMTIADGGSPASFPATPSVTTVTVNGFNENRVASATGGGFFSSNWTASAEL